MTQAFTSFDFGTPLADAMSGKVDEYELARNSYRLFAPKVLKSEDTGKLIAIQEFQERVLEALESDAEIILFVLPRGFAKSTLVTIGYAAYAIGRDRNIRIIVASNTEDQAVSHLTGIEAVLRDPDYHNIFGNLVPNTKNKRTKWTESVKHVLRTRAMRHPTLLGTGVGSAVVLGKRSDLIIVDDLIDQAHAHSASERDKAWEWFNGQLGYTRVPGARTIVVNTRFHPDDLAARLKAQYEGDDKFLVVDIPALEGYVDDNGDLVETSIWEERFPTEWLKRERERNYYQFQAHFMNDPIDTSKSQLMEDWLNYVDHNSVNLGKLEYFVGVDPNTDKDSIKKDYFAAAILGVDGDSKRIYLVDLLYARTDLATLKIQFRAKMNRYRPTKIMLESNAAQSLYESILNEDQEYLDYPFEKVYNTRNKMERILSMASQFMGGKISTLGERDENGRWHPIPALQGLRREWLTFPHDRDSHFDALDALDLALRPLIGFSREHAVSVVSASEFLQRVIADREVRQSRIVEEAVRMGTKAVLDATAADVSNMTDVEVMDSMTTDEMDELLDSLEAEYFKGFKPTMLLGTTRRAY